ncbi:hypothetical protein BFR47_16700 [Oceanisphaera psychrotolerans]|uniref:Glycosyl transferase family 1 domain-containing protein n=2 Tax=Oceanisphaera psychrotolerans TaxID=1414654 RepID=A0A1J4QAW4_9GAMM|nr:hypothetical protein BFR47_16700 [Oceanisphaera psychrotolerans]
MSVLFCVQLPPPIHGASVVNKTISDSSVINAAFDTRYVNISPASEIADLGKVSFKKVLATAKIYQLAIQTYLTFKPRLVYLTLSPHGAAFYKDGLLAILLKMLGAKLVFHMHGKGIATVAKKSRFKKALYRVVFKGVDVIHLSESLFYDVEPVRDQVRSLVAVPNSVQAPPEVAVEKDENIFTFVYLSNLVRTKGADVLVRAAALMPKHLQDKFQVKIVGKESDKEYTDEIQKLLDENELNNVHFIGPKYGDEKYLELCSADVFVLPTRFKNECFPLTILEAMSCGIAVISTQEGAIPTIVENGMTGDILDECTPEVLAEVMIKYIENPDYLKACGKAGREKFSAHYTPQVFEEKLTLALKTFAK